MLPKHHRLPLRTELKRVKKNCRLYRGKYFSLLVSQQSKEHFGRFDSGSEPGLAQETIPDRFPRNPSRFAFIISKKVHRQAVGRNLIRRRLTEAVRNLLVKTNPGFDGVFLVKKEILEKNIPDITKEVERIFEKAAVVKDK